LDCRGKYGCKSSNTYGRVSKKMDEEIRKKEGPLDELFIIDREDSISYQAIR